MRRAVFTAILALSACHSRNAPLNVVEVKSDRCGWCSHVSVPAILSVDVKDFQLNSRFDLVLVDAQGNKIEEAVGTQLPVRKLKPGAYYLRLSENGTLRREYAVVAR